MPVSFFKAINQKTQASRFPAGRLFLYREKTKENGNKNPPEQTKENRNLFQGVILSVHAKRSAFVYSIAGVQCSYWKRSVSIYAATGVPSAGFSVTSETAMLPSPA